MSRSYWLSLIAAIGLGLTSAANAQGIGHNASGQPGANQAHTKPKSDAEPSFSVPVQNDIKRIASALESANNKQPSSAEKQQAKDNLQSQQDMATWAKRMFWVALAEMLITAAGVVLVWRTLKASWAAAKAAEKSIKVARDVGRSQSRAYLSIEGADMYTQALSSRIHINIKNTGQTPAKWIEVESNALLADVNVVASDIPLNPRGKVQRWPLDPAGGKEFRCDPDCGATDLNDLLELAVRDGKCVVFQGSVRWETVFREIFESTFFFWHPAESANIEINKQTRSYREIPQGMKCPCLPTPTYRRVDKNGDGEQVSKQKTEKFWDHLLAAIRW